jgi:DNA mismatch repair protein MutL
VTFTLTRDGRRVRELLRARTREERVNQVEAQNELVPCRGERGPLRVEAFLSRPEAARAGAGGLTLVVNGRTVRDRALLVAVAQSYGSVLERGRYPRGVVYLDLPPELVDVNVHPQKAEVRFADPRAASDALYGILARALASAFSLPIPQRGAYARRPEPAPPAVAARGPEASELAHDAVLTHAASGFVSGPEPDESPEARALVAVHDSAGSAGPRHEVHWSSLRFVAQLRQTYLLCEGDDGLYLLDQHAAAERVTFTRLRRDYQSRAVPAQALLFPAIIEVTQAEAEIVERSGKEIAEVGLDVRVRGPEAVSIHAVPKLLQRGSPERLLRDLLSEVSRRGGRGFSDAVDLALATMACHGSVRAGDVLSPNEVKALLAALDHADFAGHCPHGRPIVTALSWAELERKVGRR